MSLRKGIWISTGKVFSKIGLERAIDELKNLGFEDLFPIFVSGGGTYYPSKAYYPLYKNKDLVRDFIKEAKKKDMKVHAWIVSLHRSNREFISKNKDLFVINKLGKSCLEDPPYVPYYYWLCPSRIETLNHLKDVVNEILDKYDVDGIHLDYIRLPDILLPKGLRKLRGVSLSDEIKPKYDFCYCSVCREKYKEKYGIDPIDVEYDTPEYSKWFKWRASKITHIVKEIYKEVKDYDSSIEVSAAVFATPSLSYKYVFQDWSNWNIDFYAPMIYHKYYEKDVDWIGEAVKENVSTGNRIYAGILLNFMKNEKEIAKAIKLIEENRAKGVNIFVYPFPKKELRENLKKAFELT